MKIYGYRIALIVLLLVSITSVCFAGKSVERLMTDAKSGDAEAQLTLGMRYAAGRGIPQNCSAALNWIKKSADQGNIMAQFELGQIYELGTCDVQENAAEAFKWYRNAAAGGYSAAMAALGTMYKDGRGIQKNLIKAYSYTKIGMLLGFWPAEEDLTLLLRNMTAKQVAEGEKMCKELIEKLPDDAKEYLRNT